MNAYTTTARDLAAALIGGAPRVKQTVHRVTSRHGGGLPDRYIVSVKADGASHGEYYEVSRYTLDLLERGTSPEYLELEPAESDTFDDIDDEVGCRFDRTAMMRRSGAFGR